MIIRGALHIHTLCSDGEMDIFEAIDIYKSKGFDFIAFTDHDFLMKNGCYDVLDELDEDILIFKGIEKTVFVSGYVHVNEIYGKNEVLRIFNHPADLNMSIDEILKKIQMTDRLIGIHAVEITSRGFYTPEIDKEIINYPKVATDDAHNVRMCGRAWIEMDAPLDKDIILRKIKAGDFWNCFI